MNNSVNTPFDVTSDEKLLALLSHLSILFGGLLVPFIIWMTQKDKSNFVRYHSLQAIFYHLSFTVILMFIIFFMVFVMIISGAGLGIFADAHNSGSNEELPGLFIMLMIAFYFVIFLFAIGGIVYGIYLGIKAHQGYLTRVPVIGKIIYRKVYGSNS